MIQDQDLEKLTDKQRAFIEAYTSQSGNRNITKSAIIAGFSKHTANAIGSRLLRRPDIRAIVDSRLNLTYEVWRQEGIDAYRTLDLKSPVRAKYWELTGKSAGWLKDNEVTINHLTVSQDDILKLRNSLQSKGLQIDNQSASISSGVIEPIHTTDSGTTASEMTPDYNESQRESDDTSNT